jgi:NAD-dependent SIR2 family protein deacetylase
MAGGFELIEVYHSPKTREDIYYLRCDNCGKQFEYKTYPYLRPGNQEHPKCPECQFPDDQGTCMELFIERMANDF